MSTLKYQCGCCTSLVEEGKKFYSVLREWKGVKGKKLAFVKQCFYRDNVFFTEINFFPTARVVCKQETLTVQSEGLADYISLQ